MDGRLGSYRAEAKTQPATSAGLASKRTRVALSKNLQTHLLDLVVFAPPTVVHRLSTTTMSLVSGEKSNFQFILRLLNTNVRIPTIRLAPSAPQSPDICLSPCPGHAESPHTPNTRTHRKDETFRSVLTLVLFYRLMASRRSCTP
jgi:hypothetical protein